MASLFLKEPKPPDLGCSSLRLPLLLQLSSPLAPQRLYFDLLILPTPSSRPPSTEPCVSAMKNLARLNLPFLVSTAKTRPYHQPSAVSETYPAQLNAYQCLLGTAARNNEISSNSRSEVSSASFKEPRCSAEKKVSWLAATFLVSPARCNPRYQLLTLPATEPSRSTVDRCLLIFEVHQFTEDSLASSHRLPILSISKDNLGVDMVSFSPDEGFSYRAQKQRMATTQFRLHRFMMGDVRCKTGGHDKQQIDRSAAAQILCDIFSNSNCLVCISGDFFPFSLLCPFFCDSIWGYQGALIFCGCLRHIVFFFLSCMFGHEFHLYEGSCVCPCHSSVYIRYQWAGLLPHIVTFACLVFVSLLRMSNQLITPSEPENAPPHYNINHVFMLLSLCASFLFGCSLFLLHTALFLLCQESHFSYVRLLFNVRRCYMIELMILYMIGESCEAYSFLNQYDLCPFERGCRGRFPLTIDGDYYMRKCLLILFRLVYSFCVAPIKGRKPKGTVLSRAVTVDDENDYLSETIFSLKVICSDPDQLLILVYFQMFFLFPFYFVSVLRRNGFYGFFDVFLIKNKPLYAFSPFLQSTSPFYYDCRFILQIVSHQVKRRLNDKDLRCWGLLMICPFNYYALVYEAVLVNSWLPNICISMFIIHVWIVLNTLDRVRILLGKLNDSEQETETEMRLCLIISYQLLLHRKYLHCSTMSMMHMTYSVRRDNPMSVISI